MPRVQCTICSKDFYAKPNWLQKGWGKYCSTKCRSQGQFNGIYVKCTICSKDVYKTKLQLERSRSKSYFCGKSCQTIWRNTVVYIGENHSNWKGGAEVEYRARLIGSGVEQYCRVCGAKDKRILCVHHLDKNRKNNALENLTWLCHNCHYLVHHYGVVISREDKDMVGVA